MSNLYTPSISKTIAGISFTHPSELKEKLYRIYSSTYELTRLDRDTLRQFAKEFGKDVRKLKKVELVESIWTAIESQSQKNDEAAKFLLDKTAPVNAIDIAVLMDKGLSSETVRDIILASLRTYTDHNGIEHKYEASTVIKTYLPKINTILLGYGDDGARIHYLLNKAVEPERNMVHAITKGNTVAKHNNLKPISSSAIVEFISNTVSRCSGSRVNWLNVGLALALLTGRRQGEIFGAGKFVKVDDTHVLFSGQLKTKTREDVGGYTIPVVDADWVMLLIDTLTELGKRGKELAYINKTISTCYSRNADSLKALGLDSFKDTRVSYALYHCENTKPLTMSDDSYRSVLMGHGSNDIETGLSYVKYRLVE